MRFFKFNNHHILFLLLLLSLCLGYLIPLSHKEPKFFDKTLFGLSYDYDDRNFNKAEVAKDLDAFKELGINIFRPKALDLEFDKWLVKEAKKRKLDLVFHLDKEAQIKDYLNTFKGQVSYWQLGNEPNNNTFAVLYVSPPTLKNIVSWYQKNCAIIKSIDPKAKIIINASDFPTFSYSVASWLNFYNALEREKVDYDVVGIDCYGGGPYQFGYPTDNLRLLKAAQRWHKPVFLMEYGSPTIGDRNETQQANFIRDGGTAALCAGVNAIFVFEAFDSPGKRSGGLAFPWKTDLNIPGEIEDHFGIMRSDRSPKMAYNNYKMIIDAAKANFSPCISMQAKTYLFLSAFYRLIMLGGGPLGYVDIVLMPLMIIFIGIIFKYSLGKLLGAAFKWNFKGSLIFSLAGSLLLISVLIYFYKWTGTFPMYKPIDFMLFPSITILLGMLQIATFIPEKTSDKIKLFSLGIILLLLLTYAAINIQLYSFLYYWIFYFIILAVWYIDDKILHW